MSTPRTSSDNTVLICRTDLQGRITHGSEAFIRLSGYTSKELLQQSGSLLKHPDMPAHIFSSLWSALQQRKPWMGLLKNRRKDGSTYWLNVYIKPVFGADGIQAYGAVYSSPSQAQTERAEKLYSHLNSGGTILQWGSRINRLLGIALPSLPLGLLLSAGLWQLDSFWAQSAGVVAGLAVMAGIQEWRQTRVVKQIFIEHANRICHGAAIPGSREFVTAGFASG
jgi:aerotaxis receptor